jgi:hypothetical protein
LQFSLAAAAEHQATGVSTSRANFMLLQGALPGRIAADAQQMVIPIALLSNQSEDRYRQISRDMKAVLNNFCFGSDPALGLVIENRQRRSRLIIRVLN